MMIGVCVCACVRKVCIAFFRAYTYLYVYAFTNNKKKMQKYIKVGPNNKTRELKKKTEQQQL